MPRWEGEAMHCRYNSKEYQTRNYALHLALLVRRQNGKLTLRERRDLKRFIGPHGEFRNEPRFFRAWSQVWRAIERYGDREIARLDAL